MSTAHKPKLKLFNEYSVWVGRHKDEKLTKKDIIVKKELAQMLGEKGFNVKGRQWILLDEAYVRAKRDVKRLGVKGAYSDALTRMLTVVWYVYGYRKAKPKINKMLSAYEKGSSLDLIVSKAPKLPKKIFALITEINDDYKHAMETKLAYPLPVSAVPEGTLVVPKERIPEVSGAVKGKEVKGKEVKGKKKKGEEKGKEVKGKEVKGKEVKGREKEEKEQIHGLSYPPYEPGVNVKPILDKWIDDEYQKFDADKYGMSKQCFRTAMIAYLNALQKKRIKKKDYFMIVDYSLPSTKRRMWILDMNNEKLVEINGHKAHYAAHGRNTGTDKVISTGFSNQPNTNKSSIGLKITSGEPYSSGSHRYRLRMRGIEPGINNNDYTRGILIEDGVNPNLKKRGYTENYVSEEFIKQTGRLGRSNGCISVEPSITKDVMNKMKDGRAVFVYYSDPKGKYRYTSKSKFQDEKLAYVLFLVQESL